MSAEPVFASDYGHTWNPSSLIERAANPPEPPTIAGLLYPGKRTLLSGETESLKTWFALILAKAEMEIGCPVAWADVDAMGPGAILSRLRTLGVPDETIHALFVYYEPAQRLVDDALEEVCAEIAERGIRLFVVDAFNPILNLHGLDPGSTPDIETFWREIADPITRAGAAPVLLDHVVKNADARGKYAYGAERKASGAIVHVGFRSTGPALTRGGTGRVELRTHKDRPGYLSRPVIGNLVLVSDGELITYSLEPDHSHDGDTFRPTVLMERISRRLEGEFEPVSKAWIEENVKGKAEYKRDALRLLAEEGYVEVARAAVGHAVRSIRPYREADEEPFEPDPDTSSLPRPGSSLNLRSSTSSLVPSLEGRGTNDRLDLVQDLVPLPADRGECERHPAALFWRGHGDNGRVFCAECIPPIDGVTVEWEKT